ncbi:helix-turn-helix domain-containing protein [Paenibacillus sp. LMG 31461]|uniref:Helix-turn-helix domain-containing protein n=1 Tax=Paenibacillus plantarum TaxID=2654975 RepID=A0ABX1XGR9_9BACL|nr:AraC family transcriptional regulator [Paenibacillus plantarum]NOU67070.1 helix-turn-helix domain-containing protein [Paenibacillus plantarum]
MSYPIYGYREFLGEEFPFRIRTRNVENYNTVVHAHEHFQLSYVASGSCIHHIRNNHSIVVKGDFFAIPPYLEHILLPREGKDFEVVEIDFMPSIINENMQSLSHMEHFFDFAYIQPLVSIGNELLPKLNVTPVNQRRIEELISSMQRESAAELDGYMLSIKADLLKLLVLAGREFRNYHAASGGQPSINVHRQAFYEAIEYIDTHYMDELRLEELAKKSFMSPSYFSSTFKLLKGKSFIEYVNDIRISKGIELLVGSDQQITDISYRVGFNNVGHFNRMFKHKTGLTPSEYRKHSRQQASNPMSS